MKALGVVFSNIYDSSLGELTNNRTVASLPFGGRAKMVHKRAVVIFCNNANIVNTA